ncbi:MAG: hypothetical protein WAV20_02575, partial [Blastocatellia bacterium]
MRTRRLIFVILIAVLTLAHRSDGQQTRPVAQQLRLAGVMPPGAMVYVQASDLSALMKTWLASRMRSQFYDSPSFAAFQKSRVYLKLQDRKKDFEGAIGFGLDENRLAELAGRASAVSIYDIGKIEIVLVTEVPRARAVASTLFKHSAQFQERSADGTSYYVHDVTTDGGRLNQQFCFAYVEGKLIVTTTEGLMIRSNANAKAPAGESLLSDIVALADVAQGFAAHDITMWLDQARLNRNRYFDNYWIHRNRDTELARIENGLVDMRLTRDGMTEQRWFRIAREGTGPPQISNEQVAALTKFAPADAQLVEVHGAVPETFASAVERALFVKLPDQSWSPPEIPDRTRNRGGENDSARAERYSRLDARFDIDVDDEQAPKRGSAADGGRGKSSQQSLSSNFSKRAGPVLNSLSGHSYCEILRSKAEPGKPFVRFERAIVAQISPQSAVNRNALERLITDELRSRFVVSGTEARLEWRDEGEVRFVAQSLLDQGAAYSISGGFLVLASSKDFAT